jgi:hypothetical protein
MLHYQEINSAILEGRDIDMALVKKDKAFYAYLFNNKVAYYYSSELSMQQNNFESAIVQRGREFDELYRTTLKFISEVCTKHKIPFVLFKTHKYIPEVVDGDIDVLVRQADFNRFLEVFAQEGFMTEEDEPGKGKCIKDGFSLIEPHINISWRTNKFLDGELAWQGARTVTYKGLKIPCCSPEIELFAAAGELYFSPEYIDLFRLKTMDALLSRQNIVGNLADSEARLFVDAYIDSAKSVRRDQKLPYFLPSTTLLSEIGAYTSPAEKAEILFKNFYWRARYKLIDVLPFTHDWDTNK